MQVMCTPFDKTVRYAPAGSVGPNCERSGGWTRVAPCSDVSVSVQSTVPQSTSP